MITAKDLRASYLGYFEKNGHKILPSSSLVPQNDPTLMFTNAGMVQFKNIFTGVEKTDFKRATTSQKCVRAGGKHNDLDNVGYTARHHTFFEMLGNFSFADYFKEEAITFAWELVTKELSIPKEKLLVTVYHTDDEAFNFWKKIAGLSEDRIIRIPTSDNFWTMGDTGPCGPCSEIFYDHGDHIPGGPPGSADADGDRFIEIWNLVFMQYEQVTKEERINLPKPCVDTGMGLERVAAVLQGVHNNYEIDLFRNIISATQALAKVKETEENGASFKVIADHLRSTCFLMADGVLPSNEGRGYVLRRIMRRAMRHVHLLGVKDTLMHRLVPALISEMGEAYPELKRAEALLVETLKNEEERFRETLERGLKLLNEERANIPSGGKLSGEAAFKLYDTYGFPLDLTQDILRGDKMEVDTAGFESAMEEQRTRARAAWKGSGDASVSTLWFELREQHGATEFLGYTSVQGSGVVLALVKDGQSVDKLAAGEKGYLLTNQTPFYGESGGQTGDTGKLLSGLKPIGEVLSTIKPLSDLHVHEIMPTIDIKVGDAVELEVDNLRRDRIRANHSATHLLHAALRRTLGEHISQKGSLVSEDRLRFDISHPKALTPEEVTAIENEVNEIIWQNAQAFTKLMKPEEAIEQGAMALFGEKYGDEVRVLMMGYDPKTGNPYSTELCGGTHVKRTGDIGLFKIVSESAIAAGIRRIEAVTRDTALTYLSSQEKTLKDLAGEMKIGVTDLPERIAQMQAERKSLQKELAEAKKQLALGGSGGSSEVAAEQIGNVEYFARHFADLPPKELRGVAESLLKGKETAVVAITSGFDGKGSVVVAVSKPLTDKHNAAELVKLAVPAMGGQGGGGRPEMAQGGGPEGDKGEAALDAIRDALKKSAA